MAQGKTTNVQALIAGTMGVTFTGLSRVDSSGNTIAGPSPNETLSDPGFINSSNTITYSNNYTNKDNSSLGNRHLQANLLKTTTQTALISGQPSLAQQLQSFTLLFTGGNDISSTLDICNISIFAASARQNLRITFYITGGFPPTFTFGQVTDTLTGPNLNPTNFLTGLPIAMGDTLE